VHLVVHQVVELEHVHVADGDRPLEGSPVRPSWSTWSDPVSDRPPRRSICLDLVLGGAVEHRRCHRHAAAQVLGQLQQLVVAEAVEVLDALPLVL
jgi:hypothetical protein